MRSLICEAGRSVGICGRKKTLVIRDVKKNKKSENGPQQHSTSSNLLNVHAYFQILSFFARRRESLDPTINGIGIEEEHLNKRKRTDDIITGITKIM